MKRIISQIEGLRDDDWIGPTASDEGAKIRAATPDQDAAAHFRNRNI